MGLKRSLHEFGGLFKVDPIPAGSLRFRVLSLLGLRVLSLLGLFAPLGLFTYLWNVIFAISGESKKGKTQAVYHVRDKSRALTALRHFLNLASHFESRDAN